MHRLCGATVSQSGRVSDYSEIGLISESCSWAFLRSVYLLTSRDTLGVVIATLTGTSIAASVVLVCSGIITCLDSSQSVLAVLQQAKTLGGSICIVVLQSLPMLDLKVTLPWCSYATGKSAALPEQL